MIHTDKPTKILNSEFCNSHLVWPSLIDVCFRITKIDQCKEWRTCSRVVNRWPLVTSPRPLLPPPTVLPPSCRGRGCGCHSHSVPCMAGGCWLGGRRLGCLSRHSWLAGCVGCCGWMCWLLRASGGHCCGSQFWWLLFLEKTWRIKYNITSITHVKNKDDIYKLINCDLLK